MKTIMKRRIAKRRRRIKSALLIACMILIVYGGIRMIVFCVNSIKTRMVNNSIGRDYEQQSLPVTDFGNEESTSAYVVSSYVGTYNTAVSDNIKNNSTSTNEYTVEDTPAQKTSTQNISLLDTYQYIGQSIQKSMQKLYRRNNDLIAWLDIDGVLRLPVVYRDNTFYLDHDYDGNKNKSGTLFLDEKHPFISKTQHLVIHGHDMVDGSMFGLLIHYRDVRYIYEHGIISLNTLFQDERYIVFAVMTVSEDINSNRYFPYTGTPNFSSVDEFNAFINQVKMKSLFDIPISIKPNDAILTLSTCLNDNRVLVMFRRIRDDETEEELSNILLRVYNTNHNYK